MNLISARLIFQLPVVLLLMSCSDDNPEPKPLPVSSIIATGTNQEDEEVKVDLYANTSATDVPVNSSIEVLYAESVDGDFLGNQDIITITNGNENLSIDYVYSSHSLELYPSGGLEKSTQYTLTLQNLKADDGIEFDKVVVTFHTED